MLRENIINVDDSSDLCAVLAGYFGTDMEYDLHWQHAKYSWGCPISLRVRLSAALRWLAGESYLDIWFEFGMNYDSIYQHEGVLRGILNALDDIRVIGFPKPFEALCCCCVRMGVLYSTVYMFRGSQALNNSILLWLLWSCCHCRLRWRPQDSGKYTAGIQ